MTHTSVASISRALACVAALLTITSAAEARPGLSDGLVGIFLTASPAAAWGPEGHDLIAAVAKSNLTPALQTKSDQILARGNSLVHSYIDKEDNKPVTCNAVTLSKAANWPDCVRYSTDKQYNTTGPVHFDDIPLKTPTPPKSVYCVPTCGSEALAGYIKMLTAPKDSVTDRKRAEALLFIIHIVGDLHQPLHAEDNGDGGGNSVFVTIAKAAMPGGNAPYTKKFHSFWDGDMVRAAVGSDEPKAIAIIDKLANAANLKPSTPDDWSVASHAIAVQAYKRLKPAVPPGAGPQNNIGIDKAYVTHFAPQVEDQLVLASVHLKEVLSDALAKAP